MTTRDTGRELLWTPSEIGGSGHRDARPMAGPRRGPSAGTQGKGCVVTAAAIPDACGSRNRRRERTHDRPPWPAEITQRAERMAKATYHLSDERDRSSVRRKLRSDHGIHQGRFSSG